MYYSASIQGEGGTTPHCVGYATSSSPLGPFTPSDDVLVCPTPLTKGSGVIDASYVQTGGLNYLVYKYGSATDATHSSQIRLVQLDETGTKVVKGPVTLYHSTAADFDTEGPAITKGPHDGSSFFLFYVVGYYALPNYAIHYVTSDDIWGPYSSQESVPMQRGTVGSDGVYVLSPGAPKFVDATHMMFMATVPNNSSCLAQAPQTRNARVAQLVYTNATHVKLAE